MKDINLETNDLRVTTQGLKDTISMMDDVTDLHSEPIYIQTANHRIKLSNETSKCMVFDMLQFYLDYHIERVQKQVGGNDHES